MAWRMKGKLPVFKVTQRSPSGVVHRNVHRGKCTVTSITSDDSSVAEEDADALGLPTTAPPLEEPTLEPSLDSLIKYAVKPSLPDFGDDGQNVSLHAVKQKASSSAWANIRQGLLKAAVESSAMPVNQSCVMCPEEAIYRCIQCSSCAYYCHGCFGRVHAKVNIFHTGEVGR